MSAPLFTRPFLFLTLADLAYFIALGIPVYALPLYVTAELGHGETAAGLSFGAFAVAALVLRPVSGRLSDRFGRRPLLLGGAAVAAVSLIGMVWATTFALVLALRVLLGVAEALFMVTSLATVADLAPDSRLGEALSYNSLGLYLGISFGPPLGEVLVRNGGFNQAWIGAGLIGALGCLFVSLMGKQDEIAVSDTRARLFHTPALPIAVGFLTTLLVAGGFLSLAALYAADLGLNDLSVPLFAYGVIVVLGRLAFARFQDRYPPMTMAAASTAAMAMGLFVMGILATPVGLYIGVILLGLGTTFSAPAYFSAAFATAAPHQRGAASGTVSLGVDIGLGGGPVMLGGIAQASGIPGALMVGGAIGLLGAAWATWIALRSAARTTDPSLDPA